MTPSREAIEYAIELDDRYRRIAVLRPTPEERRSVIAEVLDAFAAAAVATEREACAKVAEYCYGTGAEEAHCTYTAMAIRARGGK